MFCIDPMAKPNSKPQKPKPQKAKEKPAAQKKPEKPTAAAKSTATAKAAKKEISIEKQKDNERVVCENRKARFEYFVLETLECGIVLTGTEVKSLRLGRATIDEAYGRVKDGEVWLINSNIEEYVQGNRWNHLPKRPRKLLMHKREVSKFASKANDRGLTLVALRVYFTEGRAKVLMAVCRGKAHARQTRLDEKTRHPTRTATRNAEPE
ncbi:MAG: SsrA-binding protein SmpB [Pirellulales bacterium]